MGCQAELGGKHSQTEFGSERELPSDSALAQDSRESLLGSYREFLWTPLLSPTFSLLTGQRLDFHQLADYHASRTAVALALRRG